MDIVEFGWDTDILMSDHSKTVTAQTAPQNEWKKEGKK